MIKKQLNSPDYQTLADDIEDYFNNSNIILQNARNTIKEIEFKGQKLVVKSFKKPILINRFIYTYLRKSKAERAYDFALKTHKFTPKAIACVRYYPLFLLTKSYFICEKFDFDFDMQAPLFNFELANRALIFQKFSEFIFELHANQIVHQDLSPGNILIKQTKQGYEFRIIDINRMVFKTLSNKQKAKNFNKLWADDSDLAIILSHYADLAGLDKASFVKLGIAYNQANKNAKIRKRKIKQKLGL